MKASRATDLAIGCALFAFIIFSWGYSMSGCTQLVHNRPSDAAPLVDPMHCPEPAQAIPASCGLQSLPSGERCVLCKGARACLDRHQEWCVGEGGCADGACVGAE